jgi:hypothetical protein
VLLDAAQQCSEIGDFWRYDDARVCSAVAFPLSILLVEVIDIEG